MYFFSNSIKSFVLFSTEISSTEMSSTEYRDVAYVQYRDVQVPRYPDTSVVKRRSLTYGTVRDSQILIAELSW